MGTDCPGTAPFGQGSFALSSVAYQSLFPGLAGLSVAFFASVRADLEQLRTAQAAPLPPTLCAPPELAKASGARNQRSLLGP